MPKLPQVSGAELIRLLQSLGYEVVRQRGSHIRLKKITALGEHAITVPAHKVIAKGTLSDIIGRVSLWNNISREELNKRLKQS
jgi:predicted RNA binding protein YcfA (HicA-like mRNA interferase family)